MKTIFLRVRRYLTLLSLLASSRYSAQGGWTIRRAKARIALENLVDFLTVYDLYANHHYDPLESFAKPGAVLWDIGANLCATSLIFAQNPNVSHIYADEPMPETLIYADRPLRMNRQLSSKITLDRRAVGSADGELRVKHTKKAECAIGLSEIPPVIKTLGRVKASDLKEVTVPLVDAAQVLRMIRKLHPDAQILLKLDAEGAEYQIIDRLVETGAISEISAAAIEWHLTPGAEYITSRLQASGFHTRVKALEKDGSIGMIDGWRISENQSKDREP